MQLLLLLALVVLGLMCGSELNIALFAHPTLNRQPLETHTLVRSSFARLLGRVMPFWGAGSTVLNLLAVLPIQPMPKPAWQLAVTALGLQVFVVVFSLIAPVPINSRIAKWTPASLPADWQAQEHRWDLYHWFRTGVLIVAFVLLSLSLAFAS